MVDNDDLDLYFVSLVQYNNEQVRRRNRRRYLLNKAKETIIPFVFFVGIILAMGVAGGIETGAIMF